MSYALQPALRTDRSSLCTGPQEAGRCWLVERGPAGKGALTNLVSSSIGIGCVCSAREAAWRGEVGVGTGGAGKLLFAFEGSVKRPRQGLENRAGFHCAGALPGLGPRCVTAKLSPATVGLGEALHEAGCPMALGSSWVPCAPGP